MKKFYAIIVTTIVTLLITNTILHAQNFHLFDINHSTDAYPANNFQYPEEQWENYTKYGYAVLNGVAYFTANDGVMGEAIWRSDGTAAGTYKLKDTHPESLDERMYDLTVSGDKFFFKVDNLAYGQELWASDGTSDGTSMVYYSGGTGMFYLTDVNGTLYFMQSLYGTADQLWKTDGTSEGTVMLENLNPQFGAFKASKLTNVNGRLFFVLQTYYDGEELYTSDGTPGSAHLVKDINPSWGSYPSQLTAVNGLLCFAAFDGNSKEVWISDGTEAGTYKANNPNSITVNDHAGTNFTIKNNSIYFSGNINDGNGARLCTYNTSDPSNKVKAMKTINPGFVSSNLYNITNVNGTLFFTVFNGIDQVLWKSDGTTAGTMQVKDMNPGGRNVYWYKEFENAGGTLIFSFYEDIHGSELWKSDGTEAGTVMIKEITPGVYSSQPSNITYMGNGISLFLATDEKKGFELWRTDGTEAGTTRVKDIKLNSSYSSNPFMLIANSDKSKLIFGASDTKYGMELRITDGTEAGTGVVKDLFKGFLSSNPSNAINFKDDTYFFADILDTSVHNTSDVRTIRKLCKTNGTSGGTKVLSLPALEALINGNANVYAMEAASDLLYMILYNSSASQYELWRTDETAAGTYAIKTDMPYYYDNTLKAVGDKLFFTSFDYAYGNELFVSDGSIEGTRMVKDINPGVNGSVPTHLTSFKGKLYFTGDFGYGPFIWSSDGTEEGTKQLKPGTITYASFGQTKDKLFFSSVESVGKGQELYAIDETDKIYLVKDLYRGAPSSYPDYLKGADTMIYFFANDGKHEYELWKSNGTKEGTVLVKDITEFGSTYPDYKNGVVTVHNKLFFTVNDVLWQSDGTKKGTHVVDDANLSGITGISNLTAFDNKLAFTAFTPLTGSELYVGEVTDAGLTIAKATEAAEMKANTTALNAKLYPNPVHSKATLEISGKIKDITITISDMSGKVVWQSSRNNQSHINLPTEKLAAGVYMITIKNGDETKTLKLVKE